MPVGPRVRAVGPPAAPATSCAANMACAARFGKCIASMCCAGAGDSCYKRPGLQYAQCRPRAPWCVDSAQWLCPYSWIPSDRLPAADMQKPYPPPANPRPPPLPPPPKVWAPAVSAASWSFAYANEGVQVSTHLVADEAIVGVSTDGGELMIQGDHRVFMEEPDGSTFRLHHLVNSELEFTVDVSAIGCGCVGHVYLVEPHEKRDCGRSTGCVKVDLMKGNLQTLSTTLQSHDRDGGGGNCDSNGCTYSVGPTRASAGCTIHVPPTPGL